MTTIHLLIASAAPASETSSTGKAFVNTKFGLVAHCFKEFFVVNYSDQYCPVFIGPAFPCKYGFPFLTLTRTR